MAKKIRQGAKDYTDKQKAEALTVLAQNDFNLTRTEKETGISRITLRKWKNSDEYVCRKMREIHQKKSAVLLPIVGEKTAEEAVAPVREVVAEFKTRAKKVMMDGIDRMEILITSEKDITKVAYAIKTLSELTGETVSPDVPKGNFFWHVNQMLIQNKNGNSKVNPKGNQQE